MLRRTKGNNSNAKKRHSMFMDFTHTMLSVSEPTAETTMKHTFRTKNKSLDTLALEDDLTLQEPPKAVKRSSTQKKTSKLKRSSVVLDKTLLRDYNLAVDHFENPAPSPIQNSHSTNSISSNSSKISSLFSSNSCLSIHDLLHEEMTEERGRDKNHKESLASQKRGRGTSKYLFDANHNYANEHIWDFNDEFFDLRNKPNFCRTHLEFD